MQPDQNKGDVMGGGTSSVENVGVVGDFGHGCRISEVRIGTEEMFSEVGSESRIHPSPARAFSEGWVLGLHRLHV